MTILLYFILGMITLRYIFPVLDQLRDWLLTAIEARKSAILIEQAECEKVISDIQVSMEQPQTNQIGFVIPTGSEADDEEEEEDEDDV